MASHTKSKIRNFLLFQTFKANWRRKQQLKNIVTMLIMRQQRFLIVLALSTLLLCSSAKIATKIPRVRSCRRKTRRIGWWEPVWNTYSDKRFKKTFRLSKATFSYILHEIHADIQRQRPGRWGFIEDPISPACRLGITLYRLARGDYYYTISEMTGFGVATVCNITIEVSQAIIKNLRKEAVADKFPSTLADFKESALDMEELWQFPLAFSALDGCHIPIKMPGGGAESAKEYHNFKNFYSVVLMSLVDSHYRFIWGSCGLPGNSIIFQSTDLWNSIQEGCIPEMGKVIGKANVPPLIVADLAFPLRGWLMKPYTDAVLNPQQRYFNYRLRYFNYRFYTVFKITRQGRVNNLS